MNFTNLRDDGSRHAIGNGLLLAYGAGPDWIQVHGPPYSAPVIARLMLSPDPALSVTSARERGTGIWRHTLADGGREIGQFIDFAIDGLPCLARCMRLRAPVRFELTLPHPRPAERPGDGSGFALLGCAPRGARIYADYPARQETWVQVIGAGATRAEPQGESWSVTCGPGEAQLTIAGGPAYPDCIEAGEAALSRATGEWLARARLAWRAFSAAHVAAGERLPEDAPEREAVLAAMDDTATLIRCQQGREGGVVAGHNYVLGYMRDQYGVSRGLLALGHLDAARAILEFYWDTWQRHGALHNAQGIGVPGLFHVHENDDVEITAYLILQAFDYQAAAGDDGFTRRVLPMLEWAFEAQIKHLAGGMLPFNGDETTIAGGILPRDILLDGAAEATLLFAESGRRLIAWARRAGAWPAERLERAAAAVEDARRRYRANFHQDGRWWANNPARRELAEAPRFRHGVCLGRLEGCAFFGWTRRGEDGRYYCPACYPRRQEAPSGPPPRERYALPSIALMSSYVDAALLTGADVDATLADALAALDRGGSLAARAAADRLPGYELGILLFALTQRRHPAAGRIARRLLSLRDATGAWVEYYANGAPQGTRCRPWESGINAEALARWAAAHEAIAA